jgi:urea-proton symporter
METICPPLGFGGKYYTLTGAICMRQSSYFGGKAILDQGVGYAVVLGFGVFFAVFTSFLVSTQYSFLFLF